MAEELRAIATSVIQDPEIVERIEACVADRLGADVRYVAGEAIIPPAGDLQRYVASRRTQSRCRLKITDCVRLPDRFSRFAKEGSIEIFVKVGRRIRNLQVDELLNGAPTANAPHPFYFGSFETGGKVIALWEALSGSHFDFDKLPPEQGRSLMQAIAAVNALPGEQFGFLPDQTRWVLASPDYYREIYEDRMDDEQRQKWRDTLAQTLDLLSPGGALVERVSAFGGGLLTHNDINSNNVLFLEDGSAALIDWEGATRGFPGADLRFLHKLESRDRLLDVYVDHANELGLKVRREEALAAYRIAEGMRKVYRGWAVKGLLPVQSGLALVQSVLDKQPAS